MYIYIYIVYLNGLKQQTYDELADVAEPVETDVRDVVFDFAAVQVCGVDLFDAGALDQRHAFITRAFIDEEHRVFLLLHIRTPEHPT